MAWTKLTSTNLDAFDYDEALKTLHVRFHGGRIYTYAGVPADVADGLSTAESPGSYFGRHIKDRYRAIA